MSRPVAHTRSVTRCERAPTLGPTRPVPAQGQGRLHIRATVRPGPMVWSHAQALVYGAACVLLGACAALVGVAIHLAMRGAL